jgi:hypothetical protein
MCRSISLPTAWYLAIPLEEVISHVKEYLPAHSLVPGYTPGGGGKPCAGASLCPLHGTWLYPWRRW